ncbi:GNAT family N-acetyltransferase [Enterococcus sp. LJL51]|uniref:GNAT family N-acetyltransferase n=1 Tax=Enterococcus sp. LJL51 TaxID=3416656 RepID=UPI003CF60AB8
MNIRPITQNDALEFLNMQHGLDKSSSYMLLEPGERIATVEDTVRRIDQILTAKDFLFVAIDDTGAIGGYLQAERAAFNKIQHSAYIVIGLLPSIQGKGLGTMLFEELDRWAEKMGVTRLELTVVTVNEGAVALYKKSGFEIEGTKRKAIYQDGRFLDEYYMSKIFD